MGTGNKLITGKNRKTTALSVTECKALAGMHAFSGSDYVSSLSRKGQKHFWKNVKSNLVFLKTFANFGGATDVQEDMV